MGLRKEKNFEEPIVKAWKSHVGMVETKCKLRYVQFCRSLATHGITYFEVKAS